MKKRKIGKKGQLKIQEMAFMLVGVVLFFVLVGLFALSILSKNITESANEIAEQRALSAVGYLAGTAEFICTNNKPNCVDEDKAMALSRKGYYNSFWEFAGLSVLKNSGFNKDEKDYIKCNLGNYPDCDIIEVYDKDIKNTRSLSSFVALCRREYENNQGYERCEIAKLVVVTEIKN